MACVSSFSGIHSMCSMSGAFYLLCGGYLFPPRPPDKQGSNFSYLYKLVRYLFMDSPAPHWCTTPAAWAGWISAPCRWGGQSPPPGTGDDHFWWMGPQRENLKWENEEKKKNRSEQPARYSSSYIVTSFYCMHFSCSFFCPLSNLSIIRIKYLYNAACCLFFPLVSLPCRFPQNSLSEEKGREECTYLLLLIPSFFFFSFFLHLGHKISFAWKQQKAMRLQKY